MTEYQITEIAMFAAEAIENGYNYKNCLNMMKQDYNLSQEKLNEIEKLMRSFDMETDEEYEKFTSDLTALLS
jgi:uncharacterized tellurite resistance protein B-like protein